MELGTKFGRLVGLAISALALAAFGYLFSDVLTESDLRRLAVHNWSAVVIAMLIYCLAYVPMTTAWIRLAEACGARASHMTLARVLLVSQIGKYLPGNFAQFLGRAYFARTSGVPVASSGLAMALELAGVLAASGILAAAAMALGVIGAQPGMTQAVSWISGLAGSAALLGSVWILRSKSRKVRALAGPLVGAICLYVVVLTLLAGANIILVAAIGGDWTTGLAGKVAGAFVISWLIGFVTPGSPAGLGLRELTFFALLAGTVSHDTLLLTATAFRLATIIGDVGAWLIGVLLPAGQSHSGVPKPIPL